MRRAVDLHLVTTRKAFVVSKVISEGVALDQFLPSEATCVASAAWRKRLGIAGTDFVFGFVGRLTRDKGVTELIDAFDSLQRSCSNVKLVLAGHFESGDPVGDECKARISNNSNVISLGYTNNVDCVYHLIDVLVLPTHREGLGKDRRRRHSPRSEGEDDWEYPFPK